MDDYMTNAEVEALAGLAPRLLRVWTHRGVMRPSRRALAQHRPGPRWSLQDAVAIRVVQALREATGERVPLAGPVALLLRHVRLNGGKRVARHILALRVDGSPLRPGAWELIAPGDSIPPGARTWPVQELVQQAQQHVDARLPAVIAARRSPGRPQRERGNLRLAGAVA